MKHAQCSSSSATTTMSWPRMENQIKTVNNHHNQINMKQISKFTLPVLAVMTLSFIMSCEPVKNSSPLTASNAAEKVYVEPGKYDEFYMFASGGFSGQVAVYGLPSGRLFKVTPV